MTSHTIHIGGSRGGREGRTPPPGRPNSFDFMQFSGKFGVFTPPLEGSRPPLGKILDPPLIHDTVYLLCTLNLGQTGLNWPQTTKVYDYVIAPPGVQSPMDDIFAVKSS